MKVIIAGSRNINAYQDVKDAWLTSSFDITEVVSGGARGVDRLGERLAVELGVPFKQFIPDWTGPLKKGAGFARNKEMADYADALIAVWDGESNGTQNMINQMRKLNKPVYVRSVR